jgi:hypothetical protein
MFPWFGQGGEIFVYISLWSRGGLVLGVEGESRGAFEGVGHYYYSGFVLVLVWGRSWDWGKKGGRIRFKKIWSH